MKKYINSHIIAHQLSNLKQITFEVTDSCNLRCKYCGYGEFYEDYDKRENKKMPIEYAINLIDYLIPFWNSPQNLSSDRNVYVSFYGGEPLLNMEFIKEVVQHIETLQCQNRHFTFSMTTNGILLDKHIDYLVAKNFNLLVSLDGNHYNNSYRVDLLGNESFDRVVKNIDLIFNRYPKFFLYNVNFNAVLHNRNSIQDIYDFFTKTYKKNPSIGELNNMGIKEEKIDLFQRTYRNVIESLHQSEHYEKIEKEMFLRVPTFRSVLIFLHQFSDFVYRDYNELLFGKKKVSNWITGTCQPFSKKIFVTVNGKILPCERIGHQFSLGLISKEGVFLDFAVIEEKYNHYLLKLEKQCSKCYRKSMCTQCVFNIENLENEPICHGYMTKKEFDKYVKDNINFISQNPEEYYKLMEEVYVE